MVNFDKFDKKATESHAAKVGESNYPDFTSVEPGTKRLFKIVEIRPNEIPTRKPNDPDTLWDVIDLVDKETYTLNTPTTLLRQLKNQDEAKGDVFGKGDYLYVRCPAEKTPPKSGGKGPYWDFVTGKPSEAEVAEMLADASTKKSKK